MRFNAHFISINIKRMRSPFSSSSPFLLARRHHIDNIGVVVVGVGVGIVVAGSVEVGLVQVVVVVVDVVVGVHHQGQDGQDETDVVERVGTSEDAVHVGTCPQLLLLPHVHSWHVPLPPNINIFLRCSHSIIKHR